MKNENEGVFEETQPSYSMAHPSLMAKVHFAYMTHEIVAFNDLSTIRP